MDEPVWRSSLDSPVSTGEPYENETAALAEGGMTVADVIGFESSEPPEPRLAAEPDDVLAEFDGLAARLRNGAETVSQLRGRVEQLCELSVETRGELDRHRERLEAAGEAQRRDRETITELEERLAHRTQAVTEMRTRLGELMRDFEAIG